MAYKAKSYNKLLATAATATLVAGAIAPFASAASFTDVAPKYKEAVDFVVSKGIQGFDADTFGTSQNIKRVDAAVMVAKVLGLDVDNAPASGFTDVPDRAAKYVNAIKAAGITQGKTTTKFDSQSPITRGELAIWIQKGFELQAAGELPFTDVSPRYEEAVKALVHNKVTNGVSATQFGVTQNAKRGDFAIFLFKAAQAQSPEVVEVTNVTAVNGKEITVEFNAAIDEESLKDASNNDVITVVAKEGATTPAVTQTLSEDGKTLTLKADTYFKGDYTVKVPFEVVKDVKGNFVKPVNQEINVNDTTAPVVTAAKALVKSTDDDITSIELTFDEDIAAIGNVKIDGQNYTAVANGDRTATISGLTLDASKNYDVTIVNAKDAAGNVKDVQTAELEVEVDDVAPSITNVEAIGENTVKVTVDEALADDLAITAKVGTFETDIVTDIEAGENANEYIVTLNPNYLFKNGNTDTVTLTVAEGALKDALGNANEEAITKTVVVSKDVVAPEVTDVKTTSVEGKVTAFTVTFSEEVEDLNTSKVKVVNSKGQILSLANVATVAPHGTDAKKVVFTLVDGLEADKYSFDLAEGFVTDTALAANKNIAKSFTVDVTDAQQPVETTFNIESATADANVITVDFGAKVKATGTGSALNPSAYQLNGVTLPEDTEIAFVGTPSDDDYQTKVEITLPEGFVKANDDKAIFRVTGVQTLDNKVSNPFMAEVAVTDNTAPVLTSFVATDIDALTLTYSEAIATLADDAVVTDEIKLFNSEGEEVAFTTATVNAEGKLVLDGITDAASVVKVTTIDVVNDDNDTTIADIKDVANNAQKAGVVVTK